MEEEKTESVEEPEIVMEENEDSMSEEIQTVIDEEPGIIEIEEKEEPVDLTQTETNLDIASMRHDITKCNLKKDIIEGIQRLQPGKYSNTELRKKKKAELKQLLTDTFEEKCRETLVGPDDEKLPENPDIRQKRRDGQMVTEAMYQVVLGLCSVTEGLSKRYNGYLGGMCLHNWRQTIDDSEFTRETLKQVLFEVYLEHQETLTQLMSKEGRLICCLVLSGIQCVRKYSPDLENEQRYRSKMEQDYMYSRGSQSRKNEPGPIPDLSALGARMRFNNTFRERRLSDPMGIFNRTQDAAQSLP